MSLDVLAGLDKLQAKGTVRISSSKGTIIDQFKHICVNSLFSQIFKITEKINPSYEQNTSHFNSTTTIFKIYMTTISTGYHNITLKLQSKIVADDILIILHRK